MKIYTRTGDSGETGLLGGGRVGKDDQVVAVCGALDEANCLVGLVRCHQLPPPVAECLEAIQQDLFCIGGTVAACRSKQSTPPRVDPARIGQFELEMDQLDQQLPELSAFILPGGVVAGAQLHLCRAVVRRAERQLVQLIRAEDGTAELDLELVYLNRLSDLLFVQARYINQVMGIPETQWIPN